MSAERNIKHGLPVLVIGGGISGISAAVEAAETGLRVYLVEKQPYLGGWVSRMNEYFPKLCPPYCGLEINFRRIRNNHHIEVLTSSEVYELSGTAGNYRAMIRRDPEYVTSACTVCGDCSGVCPEEMDDPYNMGLTRRKAIDLPHELTYPPRFNLDPGSCRMGECDECAKACRFNAIKLDAAPTKIELAVGSVIFCTGWEPYDPAKIPEYMFNKSPNIISNVMMERLGAPNGPFRGKILRLSDHRPAHRIAFIQCAGSRDENHLPYCSAVCCSASLKQAMYFTGLDPENQADIFYIDLRVSGRNEDFLNKVENHERIRLVKGKASGIKLEGGEPVVEVEDILSGRKIRNKYDMVVLATGIVPRVPELKGPELKGTETKGTELKGTETKGTEVKGTVFKGPDLDGDGFILKPGLEEGMSAGGCCTEPKDVAATVRESTGLVINSLKHG